MSSSRYERDEDERELKAKLDRAMAVVRWCIDVSERVGCPCDSADSAHNHSCPLVVNGFINPDGSRKE